MRKELLLLSTLLLVNPVSAISMENLERETVSFKNTAYIYINAKGDPAMSEEVTREHLAKLIYINAGSPSVEGNELLAYSDAHTISTWALEPLLWCVKMGIMEGEKGLLSPKKILSLEESSTLLQKAKWAIRMKKLPTDLEILTKQNRAIGSVGEQEAVSYLKTRFTDMGYQVETQDYQDKAGRKGSNVIATLSANKPNADILVISAHHDSVPTTFGANDNASGVAALLAVAEAMRGMESDTEIRFISFTDEENGKNGSRHYTSTLSQSEKQRMIGDIQLDMLGGLGATGLGLYTCDGNANWLTKQYQTNHPTLTLHAETASDHTSFQLAGIPSVLLMQQGRGYLYHSGVDVANQLDTYAISQAALQTVEVVSEIASSKTTSYQNVAQEQGEQYTYNQIRQNVIYFDSSLSETEAFIGTKGKLVDSKVVEGPGWKDTYDAYFYSMRWFGAEKPMNTYYQYRNGYLMNIEIKPAENGYTKEEIVNLMTQMYGEPKISKDRNGKEVISYIDTIYSKYLSVVEVENGYKVTVSKYSLGISNVLSSYKVVDGEATIQNEKDAAIWEYVCSILPLEARKKIVEFNLFSDGASGILAFTSPVREKGKTDNTRFSISIDYYDVYDETGNKRDWSKLTHTIIHEYGHVLLEDETQIDLRIGKDTHDPAGFIKGSFRKQFYDTFWKELGESGVQDYEANPTHYVSRYGANYFHEDIADTFAMFVLGGKPSGTSVAEQKLMMFWDNEEMVTLRQNIRELLGIDA